MPVAKPNNPGSKYVRAKQAALWASVSKSTWYNWVRAGRVPPGVKLSPGVTVWSLDEVATALGLGGEVDA